MFTKAVLQSLQSSIIWESLVKISFHLVKIWGGGGKKYLTMRPKFVLRTQILTKSHEDFQWKFNFAADDIIKNFKMGVFLHF